MLRIAVESKYAEINGGYIQVDTHDGKPLLRKDVQHGGQVCWLFHASGFGSPPKSCWYFGASPPTKGRLQSYSNSTGTAPTPDRTCWPLDDIECVRRVGNEGDSGDVDLGLWFDPEFPHTPDSLGIDVRGVNSLHVQWLPVRTLSVGTWQLFDNIEPTDLLQGSLGDCWLVAAISAMAEFPEEVMKLFKSQDLSRDGRYQIRLFDHRRNCSRTIEVDEYVPCHPKHWWDARGKPLFSRPNGNEAWVLLLEKGMAKMFGSYGKLDGGNTAVAFRALTGEPNVFMWARSSPGVYDKYTLKPGDTNFYATGRPEQKRGDAFFMLLKDYDQSNYLLSCSISNRSGIREAKRKDGLVEGHAYALLQVVEVEGHRLLCMRNPWGNDRAWKGDWSDGSSKWTQSLQYRLRPEMGADGVFWMCWADFSAIWTEITICCKQMRNPDEALAHAKASREGIATTCVGSGVLPSMRHTMRPKATPLGTMHMKPKPTGPVNCPGLHGMLQHPPGAVMMECDVCKQMKPKEGAFGCHMCGFDACARCVAHAGGVVQPQAPQPQAPQPAAPAPMEIFEKGAKVEYWSDSRHAWLPAQVLGYDAARNTYMLTVHPSAAAEKVRKSPYSNTPSPSRSRNRSPHLSPSRSPRKAAAHGAFQPFPAGMAVEYHSDSRHAWIDAVVISYDPAAHTYKLSVHPAAPAAKVRQKHAAQHNGHQDGHHAGHHNGHRAGNRASQHNGYPAGQHNGYPAGHHNGHHAGQTGYPGGQHNGNPGGHHNGYHAGHHNGYHAGHNGYNAVQHAAPAPPTAAQAAIAAVAVSMAAHDPSPADDADVAAAAEAVAAAAHCLAPEGWKGGAEAAARAAHSPAPNGRRRGCEESTQTCPRGHVLRAQRIEQKGFSCDPCRKPFPIGSQTHSCRECDYDVCGMCLAHPGLASPKASARQIAKALIEDALSPRGHDELDYDQDIGMFDQLRHVSIQSVSFCAHGCGRPSRGRFPTCCDRCGGPAGPHARDCEDGPAEQLRH